MNVKCHGYIRMLIDMKRVAHESGPRGTDQSPAGSTRVPQEESGPAGQIRATRDESGPHRTIRAPRDETELVMNAWYHQCPFYQAEPISLRGLTEALLIVGGSLTASHSHDISKRQWPF